MTGMQQADYLHLVRSHPHFGLADSARLMPQIRRLYVMRRPLKVFAYRPVFVVLVRPSRFTYSLIESSHEFIVNVPTAEMRRWVAFCGSHSGRDHDKFSEFGMTVTPGQHVHAVTIDACPMVYECRSIHYNDVIPNHLDSDIEKRSYGGSDYHRVYYGQILGTYAAPDY